MCNISTLQADFDAMLSFLKGERSSNNHENGYAQLTSYLLDRVVAADKNEHSYTKTPDYHQVIKGINNEITSMEEHAILDFFAINVLNNMSKKVKEYEIDNNIITVNEDEAPFAKYENTASEMLQSLRTMDDIFNKVINDNNNKTFNIAPYTKGLQKLYRRVVAGYRLGLRFQNQLQRQIDHRNGRREEGLQARR